MSKSEHIKTDYSWLCSTMAVSIEYHETKPIDEWAEDHIMLPSNTAEPGHYSADRAPYQRQLMRDMSPDSPVKLVVLCWGSQNGKTTAENNIMAFYMKESPCPIAFGFSDDANLKNYVKNKFDPLLDANPEIKRCLKAAGGKGSGDALTGKSFPGGFIKFLSGKSEASLRSDSVMLFVADEFDAWGITKGGDPLSLLRKRTNTYGDRGKIIVSSTPVNTGSITYETLKTTTYNKYGIRCPECGEYYFFEMDNFHWEEEEGEVKDAWMECPHCHRIVHNEDKITLLTPEHGAKWIPTRPKADPCEQGYYLPTFYAPVGWLGWKDIAKEYIAAFLNPAGVDYEKATVFYNTILAMPYIVGAENQDWRLTYEKNLTSGYQRGQIPEWVEFLTTGSDLQGNRIETTLFGWGFRGRHIVLDHYVFYIGDDEDIEQVDGNAWTTYAEVVLHGEWERADGYKMRTLANAFDRGYKPDSVNLFRANLNADDVNRFFPVRGNEKIPGLMPTTKIFRSPSLGDCRYWDVPVSNIKRQIYSHLKMDDNTEGTIAMMPFYPKDFDQEFYMQLFSEYEITEKGKQVWKKNRERNEILDTHVYNYAMFHLSGLSGLSDENWEDIKLSHRQQSKPRMAPPKQRRRVLSAGIQL